MPPAFREALEDCLAAIPSGRVTTCGSIAAALGDVRAARTVAAWLLAHPGTPGAYRVVRADGRPILPGASRNLELEGVRLREERVPSERFAAGVSVNPLLAQLREEQRSLAAKVSEQDEPHVPRTLGGVDVSYEGERAYAVAVVLDAESLTPIEVSVSEVLADFPYIPTYLAFREFPAVRAAIEGLARRPDLLFVDGHGRLHPAHFGFACFAGVQLDLPTVGIAKHPLVGRPSARQPRIAGATALEVDGRVQGCAWAPPGRSRPYYISVGHRISLGTAVAAAQRATRRAYPEPLVVADRLSKQRKAANRPQVGTGLGESFSSPD